MSADDEGPPTSRLASLRLKRAQQRDTASETGSSHALSIPLAAQRSGSSSIARRESTLMLRKRASVRSESVSSASGGLGARAGSRLAKRTSSVYAEADLEEKNEEIEELKKKLSHSANSYRSLRQEMEGELEERDGSISKMLLELEEAKAGAMSERVKALTDAEEEFLRKTQEVQARRREVDVKLKQMTDKHKSALMNTFCLRAMTFNQLMMQSYYFRIFGHYGAAVQKRRREEIEQLQRRLADSIFKPSPLPACFDESVYILLRNSCKDTIAAILTEKVTSNLMWVAFTEHHRVSGNDKKYARLSLTMPLSVSAVSEDTGGIGKTVVRRKSAGSLDSDSGDVRSADTAIEGGSVAKVGDGTDIGGDSVGDDVGTVEKAGTVDGQTSDDAGDTEMLSVCNETFAAFLEAMLRRGDEPTPDASMVSLSAPSSAVIAECKEILARRGIVWDVPVILQEKQLLDRVFVFEEGRTSGQVIVEKIRAAAESGGLLHAVQDAVDTEAQWVFLNAMHRRMYGEVPLSAYLERKEQQSSKRALNQTAGSSFSGESFDPDRDDSTLASQVVSCKLYLEAKSIPWNGSQDALQEISLLKSYIRGQDISAEKEARIEKMLMEQGEASMHAMQSVEDMRSELFARRAAAAAAAERSASQSPSNTAHVPKPPKAHLAAGEEHKTQPAGPSTAIAERLYKAMKGLGTDEDAVRAALRDVKSADEWDAVKSEFRKHDDFNNGDLVKSLESELTASEFQECEDILAAKGISLVEGKLAPYSEVASKAAQLEGEVAALKQTLAEQQRALADSSQATVPQLADPSTIVAERLYKAMKGLGTDEDAVRAALRDVKSADEWDAVKSEFRKHDDFNNGDLVKSLESELTASEFQECEDILAAKGISLVEGKLAPYSEVVSKAAQLEGDVAALKLALDEEEDSRLQFEEDLKQANAKIAATPDTTAIETQTERSTFAAVRGHDGRPLQGFSVAQDGETALAPDGRVILAPDGAPVRVDAAGWANKGDGQRVRIVPSPKDDGEPLCLAEVSPAEVKALPDGRQLYTSGRGFHLPCGREVIVREGEVLQTVDGQPVVVESVDGQRRCRTEDGRSVAVDEKGSPFVYGNGMAAVEADSKTHGLLGPDGTGCVPVTGPEKYVTVNAEGELATARGLPVTLVSSGDRVVALVADSETGLYRDPDDVVRTRDGQEVLLSDMGQPLRTQAGSLVVRAKAGEGPTDEAGTVIAVRDGQVLTWPDGSAVVATADGRSVLGPDGTKVVGNVCLSASGEVVTSDGQPVRLAICDGGRGTGLVPAKVGDCELFKNGDGELCTESGRRVVCADGVVLCDSKGAIVVEGEAKEPVLENGTRVAVDPSGKALQIGGKVCAAGGSGQSVLNTHGGPLVAHGNAHCVLDSDARVRTNDGQRVEMAERGGAFAALVSGEDGLFLDESGSVCSRDGLLLSTDVDGRVLRTAGGAVIRQDGRTEDGHVATAQRWSDGSVVVADANGTVLDKKGNPMQGMTLDDYTGSITDTLGRSMSFIERAGEVVAGTTFPLPGSSVSVVKGSEDAPQFYTTTGEVIAVGSDNRPLSHDGLPVLRKENGLALSDGRHVPEKADGTPETWADGSPLVCDEATGQLRGTDGKVVDGVRLHKATGRLRTSGDGSPVHVGADDTLVVRRGRSFRTLAGAEVCTEDGRVAVVQDGAPLVSCDSGQFVVRDKMSGLCALEDGTRVAQSKDGDVVLWPTGEPVTAEGRASRRVAGLNGAALPAVELDKRQKLTVAGNAAQEVVLAVSDDGSCSVLIAPEADSSLCRDVSSGAWVTRAGEPVYTNARGDIVRTRDGRLVVRNKDGQADHTEDGIRIAVDPDTGAPFLTWSGAAIEGRADSTLSPEHGTFHNAPVRLTQGGYPKTTRGLPVTLVSSGDRVVALVADSETGLYRDPDDVVRTRDGQEVLLSDMGQPLRTQAGSLVVRAKAGEGPTDEAGTVIAVRDGQVLTWPDGSAVVATADGRSVLGPDGTKVVGNVCLSASGEVVTSDGQPVRLAICDGGRGTGLVPAKVGDCELFKNGDGELCTESGRRVVCADGVVLCDSKGAIVVEGEAKEPVLENGTRVAVDPSGKALQIGGKVCAAGGSGQSVLNTHGGPLVAHGNAHCVLDSDARVRTNDGQRVEMAERGGAFAALVSGEDGLFLDESGSVCSRDGLLLSTDVDGRVLRTAGGAVIRQDGRTEDGHVATAQRWSDGSVVVADARGAVLAQDGAVVPGVRYNEATKRLATAKGKPVQLLDVSGTTLVLEDAGNGLLRNVATGDLHLANGAKVLVADGTDKPLCTEDGRIAVVDASGKLCVVNSTDGEILLSETEVVVSDAAGEPCVWSDTGHLVLGLRSGRLVGPHSSDVRGVRHADGKLVGAEGAIFTRGIALLAEGGSDGTDDAALYRNVADAADIRTRTGQVVMVEDGAPVVHHEADGGRELVVLSDDTRLPHLSVRGKRVAVSGSTGGVLRRRTGELVVAAPATGRVEGVREALVLDEEHRPMTPGVGGRAKEAVRLLEGADGTLVPAVAAGGEEKGFYSVVGSPGELVDERLRRVADATAGVVVDAQGRAVLLPASPGGEERLVLVDGVSREHLRAVASGELLSFSPDDGAVAVGPRPLRVPAGVEVEVDKEKATLRGGAVVLDDSTVLQPVGRAFPLLAASLAGGADSTLREVADQLYIANGDADAVVTAAGVPVYVRGDGTALRTRDGGFVVCAQDAGGVSHTTEGGVRVALDASGMPVVFDGSALPVSPAGKVFTTEARTQQLRTACGAAVEATVNHTLRTDDGIAVAVVAGRSGRCEAVAVRTREVKDKREGCRPSQVTYYMDADGVPRTQEGDRLVFDKDDGHTPCVVGGRLLVESERGGRRLEDGTAVLEEASWADGAPLVCKSPEDNRLVTANGSQYVLGPDGQPVQVRDGQAFSEKGIPLKLSVVADADGGETVRVLRPSNVHPLLLADNEGVLWTSDGRRSVASAKTGAPLRTVDGCPVCVEADAADAAAPRYSRLDHAGTVVVHTPRGSGSVPVTWADGTVASVNDGDRTLRGANGAVVEGVYVCANGRVLASNTHEEAVVVPQSDGGGAYLHYDPIKKAYTDADGDRCSATGEKLVFNPLTGNPITTRDGAFVLRPRTAAGRFVVQNCPSTAVGRGQTGDVLVWEGTDNAVVSAKDGRTLLTQDGHPFPAVCLQKDSGLLLAADTKAEVVVAAAAAGAPLRMLTPHHGHPSVYRNVETGELCTKAGQPVLLTDQGVPYRGQGNQLVLFDCSAEVPAMSLEDGTPVARNPASTPAAPQPLTWADGRVVTHAEGFRVSPESGLLVSAATGGTAVVSTNDTVLLTTEHDGVYKAHDGSLCLADDREVVADTDGRPVRGGRQGEAARCLLRNTRCLADGTKVAFESQGVRRAGGSGGSTSTSESDIPGYVLQQTPVLWGADPARPAVVSIDNATLLGPAGQPVRGPGGSYVSVGDDGQCYLASSGEPVVLAGASGAAADMCVLLPKKDMHGHPVVLRPDVGPGPQASKVLSLKRVPKQFVVYEDEAGVERLHDGRVLVHHHGGRKVPRGQDPCRVVVQAASVPGKLVCVGVGDDVAAQEVVAVCHAGDAKPLLWPSGAVVTSTGGAVDGLEGVFTTPRGTPVDADGNDVRIVATGEGGSLVALRPHSDAQLRGLYTDSSADGRLRTSDGSEAAIGKNGWPLRTTKGEFVAVTHSGNDSGDGAAATVYRVGGAQGRTVAVFLEKPLEGRSGCAATRSNEGTLLYDDKEFGDVLVDEAGRMAKRGTGEPVMILPRHKADQKGALVLTPLGKTTVTSMESLWVGGAGELYTSGGEKAVRHEGTESVLIQRGGPGGRFCTEDERIAVFERGVAERDDDARVPEDVMTWAPTAHRGWSLVTTRIASTEVESPNGDAVMSLHGVVVASAAGLSVTKSGVSVLIVQQGEDASGLVFHRRIAKDEKLRADMDVYLDKEGSLCLATGERLLLSADGAPVVAANGEAVVDGAFVTAQTRCRIAVEEDGSSPVFWPSGAAVVADSKDSSAVLDHKGSTIVKGVKLAQDGRVVTAGKASEEENAWLCVRPPGVPTYLTAFHNAEGGHASLPDGRPLYFDPTGGVCLRNGVKLDYKNDISQLLSRSSQAEPSEPEPPLYTSFHTTTTTTAPDSPPQVQQQHHQQQQQQQQQRAPTSPHTPISALRGAPQRPSSTSYLRYLGNSGGGGVASRTSVTSAFSVATEQRRRHNSPVRGGTATPMRSSVGLGQTPPPTAAYPSAGTFSSAPTSAFAAVMLPHDYGAALDEQPQQQAAWGGDPPTRSPIRNLRSTSHSAASSSSSAAAATSAAPAHARTALGAAEERELSRRLSIGDAELRERTALRCLSPTSARLHRSTSTSPAARRATAAAAAAAAPPSSSPRKEWELRHQLRVLQERMAEEKVERMEQGFAGRREIDKIGAELERERVRREAVEGALQGVARRAEDGDARLRDELVRERWQQELEGLRRATTTSQAADAGVRRELEEERARRSALEDALLRERQQQSAAAAEVPPPVAAAAAAAAPAAASVPPVNITLQMLSSRRSASPTVSVVVDDYDVSQNVSLDELAVPSDADAQHDPLVMQLDYLQTITTPCAELEELQ